MQNSVSYSSKPLIAHENKDIFRHARLKNYLLHTISPEAKWDKFSTKNEQDVGYRIGDPTQGRDAGSPRENPARRTQVHSLRIMTPSIDWSSQKTAVRTSPRRPH